MKTRSGVLQALVLLGATLGSNACELFIPDKGGLEQECLQNSTCEEGLRCDPDREVCIVDACGNGRINTGEECDPPLSQGGMESVCTLAGYSGGQPICTADCQWSTVSCYHEFRLSDPESSLNTLALAVEGDTVFIGGGYDTRDLGNPYFLLQVAADLEMNPQKVEKFVDLAALDEGDLNSNGSTAVFWKDKGASAHEFVASVIDDGFSSSIQRRSLVSADWRPLGQDSADPDLYVDILRWEKSLERLIATGSTMAPGMDIFQNGSWHFVPLGQDVSVNDLAGARVSIEQAPRDLLALSHPDDYEDQTPHGLHIWDLDNESVLAEFCPGEAVRHIAWAENGQYLVAEIDRSLSNQYMNALRVFTPSAFGWSSVDLDEVALPSLAWWPESDLLLVSSSLEDDFRIYDLTNLDEQPLVAALKMGNADDRTFPGLLATSTRSPWLALGSDRDRWIRIVNFGNLLEFIEATRAALDP